MTYFRRVFDVPVAMADEVIAALGEAGTLGIEELQQVNGAQRLVAYFAEGVGDDVALPAGVTVIDEAVVPAADWLASHRESAQPMEVGERFVIDPREPPPRAERAAAAHPTPTPGFGLTPDPPVPLPLEGQGVPPPDLSSPHIPPGRMLLRVPARSAFGTGSHASTRLALRLLERLELAGRSVLDVGIGSGVLAMAASMLGAARADGFDVDAAAALLAGQHARLNDLRVRVWTGGSAALAPQARWDVVVVNALPHEVLPEAERIAAAVAERGVLVISGVLSNEGEPTLRAWSAHGLAPVDALAEEEWAAWTLARA